MVVVASLGWRLFDTMVVAEDSYRPPEAERQLTTLKAAGLPDLDEKTYALVLSLK